MALRDHDDSGRQKGRGTSGSDYGQGGQVRGGEFGGPVGVYDPGGDGQGGHVDGGMSDQGGDAFRPGSTQARRAVDAGLARSRANR